MSSRFPSSAGYSSRGDRSPPQRYADRRPSVPPGPREDPNLTPLGREPPRGPKALIDPPRGNLYAGRGRGYPPRNDFRDRDRNRDREFRDGPPFRRDDRDRDWGRRDRIDRDFDNRDSRPSFRRSRSPQPRDARDFRDSRDLGPRDGDIVRMRRNSRDSLVSSSSNPGDGPNGNQNIGHPPPIRGGLGRGRGRGDWEGGRGRGRGHYVDDRDPFRRRSRSRDGRDGWRDRERDREREFRDRDRDWEFDRRDRFDRRDDDRWPEQRDDRDRPPESWKKDGPPSRTEPRAPSGPRSASIPPIGLSGVPRSELKSSDQPSTDQSRKVSAGTLPPARDPRRDSDRSEASLSRTELLRDPIAPKGSPPPSAPQVPAFGFVTLPSGLPPIEKPSQPPSQQQSQPQPAPATPNKSDRSRADIISSAAAAKDLPREAPPKEAPTEPKAHRSETKGQTSIASVKESSKPAPAVSAIPSEKQNQDISPPTGPAALIKRETTTVIGDVHSDNVASVSPLPGPTSTPSPVMARSQLPSTGHGGSPQTSPRMTFTSVPTGPRAGIRQPSRGGHAKSKQWLRPGYNRGPQTAASLNNRHDSHEDKELDDSIPPVDDKKELADDHQEIEEDKVIDNKTVEKLPSEKVEILKADEESPLDALRTLLTESEKTQITENKEEEDVNSKQEKEENSSLLPDLTRSSDEEDEADIFTEDYLQKQKGLFEKSMHALQAEMPPPTLEDPVIVELLMKVQLLGMILDGSVPEEPEPSAVEINVELSKKTTSVQTYKTEMDTNEDITTSITSITVPVDTVSKDTITVDSLPFLVSGPPTPISELEVYQENIKTHERIQEAIRSTVAKQRKDASQKNKRLREEYATVYKPWRLSVREMDHRKDEERKGSTPSASTPPVTPAPPVVTEGRAESRRYKGNSELDFQNALKASAISAQEESERRRRMEATARPDLDREAIVPDMLEKYEIEAGIFKDTNNKVDPADALAVYGFYPPPDDFTVEEHKLFTDAFMAYPKKWGKIAEELPGRTFAECISHYYMTKEEIKYKAKLNKRWRSQRRTRKSTTRPKSNALMSDLKADGDDEETVQMTETGRPRRAAAPTFGGDAIAEGETSRRGAKDSDQGEKPASRRGRAGAGTRGGRRGRVAQQQPSQVLQTPLPIQAQPQAVIHSQQPPVSSAATVPGVPLIAKQEPRIAESTIETVVRVKEQERDSEELLPKSRSTRVRGKDSIYVFDASADHDAAAAKSTSEMGYGSMQPTSYWSVPEVRDFPTLLAHFGRDFEGISNFMKTKTPIMVKNYFQRKIDSGNNEFEEIVKVTDVKKMRGEPTGPLPTPNPTTKRRYEATPSAVSHRPLAPHTDIEHPEDGRLGQKKVTAAMSPRPAQELPPDRSLSKYPPLAQATGATSNTGTIIPDDALRNARQSGVPPAPRSSTGPRIGYFTEDRREPRGTLVASRAPELQPSPRVAPSTQNQEVGRLEPLPQQLRRSDFHGPQAPYQPAQHTVYMQAQQGVVPPPTMSGSHSRHTSYTGATAPGSPAQSMQKPTPEVSPIRRSSFSQTQPQPGYYPYPGPNFHPRKTVSPVKEAPARVSTPEPPRQVPVKRSNIMSILNDEPEELPPRKRFASEMVSSPRMAYNQPELGPTTSSLRHEEKPPYFPAQQQQQQQQQQQTSHGPHPHQVSSGRPSYSEYQPYPPPSLSNASAASGPPNHDWMARFDPRSQTQQSSDPIRPASTPAPPAQYGASGGYQPSQAAANSQPQASQGNPPGGEHRGYPPPHGQDARLLASNAREPSNSVYRHQNAASPPPPPPQNILPYGSRQVQSPAQSPAMPLSMPVPRQASGPGPSYSSSGHSQAASPHPLAPQHRSTHSGHQSYQQHVQSMVNGQQPQNAPPSGRSSMGIAGGPSNAASPYTTPAPLPSQQQHGGPPYRHSNQPPPNLGIGRPYTPPPGVHAPPPAPTLGGIPYPSNASAPGSGPGPAGGHMHHNSYPAYHESHGPPPPAAHHR